MFALFGWVILLGFCGGASILSILMFWVAGKFNSTLTSERIGCIVVSSIFGYLTYQVWLEKPFDIAMKLQ